MLNHLCLSIPHFSAHTLPHPLAVGRPVLSPPFSIYPLTGSGMGPPTAWTAARDATQAKPSHSLNPIW